MRKAGAAFQILVRSNVDCVLLPPDILSFTHRQRIGALAITARLPSVHAWREQVDAGGLASYGTDMNENFRRAADCVARILKGDKPGDLPVELQTKFELVINVGTAKALGIEVPPTLLARADEVIE
jgi:putative tryptophan/tyrosine transport system substrate-binding protein